MMLSELLVQHGAVGSKLKFKILNHLNEVFRELCQMFL